MTGNSNDITPVVDGYSWQGQDSYRGADYWQPDTIKPGGKLVQLDFARENAATETASKFFTTYEELEKLSLIHI